MITDLRLQNFRSYHDESFEFEPGVNIIVGPNASGKTNLLEAILVIAKGSSYRAKDVELVQFGAPWARLDAHSDEGDRTFKLEAEPVARKTYEIDGKAYRQLTLSHSIPVVLFEPNHLSLLHGSPEQRRDYLDDLLEQTRVGYGALRRHYRRTLAQRNALLKQPRSVSSNELFPWNLRLSELGSTIARARDELAQTINAQLNTLYQDIAASQETILDLHYQPQFRLDRYETDLLHKLEANTELDQQRGFTANGPHREDFVVLFNDKPSSETASRGEARTCILALKTIELSLIEQNRDIRPLLLLDDVFSELDGKRRRALTEHLINYQTFITTTDADVVTRHFAESSHLIAIDPNK